MSTITIITNKIDANQVNAMTADADLLPRTNDVNYGNGKVNTMTNGQKESTVLINGNEIAKTGHEKSNDKSNSQSTDTKNQTITNGNSDAMLSRTQTRNSCGSINGQNIAKSWYARCNRWRSQSCDRRKCSTVRYSWNNTINNRPV